MFSEMQFSYIFFLTASYFYFLRYFALYSEKKNSSNQNLWNGQNKFGKNFEVTKE